MKPGVIQTIFCLLILSLLFVSWKSEPEAGTDHFTPEQDTLIIRTVKNPGIGLFSMFSIPLIFRDTTENFADRVTYPAGVDSIRRAEMVSDMDADTKFYLDLMEGMIGSERIYIVDQNNNNDFRDDSVRTLQNEGGWETLIRSEYTIYKDEKPVMDTSWLRIGLLNGILLYGRSDHLSATFTIDSDNFIVGVIDSYNPGSFTFEYSPEAAVLEHNGVRKDQLEISDKMKIGEYLNLNGSYYRFAGVDRFGDFITLIKEENFNGKTGTQVGMKAPEFTFKTAKGTMVSSKTLADKPIVIVNSCGCGNDISSMEAYKEIEEEYGNRAYVIQLDTEKGIIKGGLTADFQDLVNQDMYEKYRAEYCSRITVVIDRERRIAGKFPATEWNAYLPEIIN